MEAPCRVPGTECSARVNRELGEFVYNPRNTHVQQARYCLFSAHGITGCMFLLMLQLLGKANHRIRSVGNPKSTNRVTQCLRTSYQRAW